MLGVLGDGAAQVVLEKGSSAPTSVPTTRLGDHPSLRQEATVGVWTRSES